MHNHSNTKTICALSLLFAGLTPYLAAISHKATAYTAYPVSFRILASGTAIYSSFGGSQSEYLIEIAGPGNSSEIAYLLYPHPQSHPEIPDKIVNSRKQFQWHLVRSTQCDETYQAFAMAWDLKSDGKLHSNNILRFVPGEKDTVFEDQVMLPCYLLLPRTVRMRRGQVQIK